MEEKTFNHAVFTSEFELTIDDKNRLLVPADVRKKIDPERDGEAFLAVVGSNRKLWFYPEKYFERLIVSQVPQEIAPADPQMEFMQRYLAMAARLEWDKQGRMLVPAKMLDRTRTGREVTLIGAGNHLELWNRPEWEARFEELLTRSTEIDLRNRELREKRTPGGQA